MQSESWTRFTEVHWITYCHHALIDWLIDQQSEMNALIDLSIDWLIDWLIDFSRLKNEILSFSKSALASSIC